MDERKRYNHCIVHIDDAIETARRFRAEGYTVHRTQKGWWEIWHKPMGWTSKRMDMVINRHPGMEPGQMYLIEVRLPALSFQRDPVFEHQSRVMTSLFGWQWWSSLYTTPNNG